MWIMSKQQQYVHVYTHKLHTCIHQPHKTSLDIFSSFILIAYAHNNDKKKSHWKISEWNISEVTIFPSKFHVSFRLQLFPPWMFLKEREKDAIFDFAANFFCLKFPLPNYMLEKPPASYNEVFSVWAKSVKKGLTYVNSRNAFSSMFIITTLSVGVFFSFAAVNILSKFSAFLGLLCKKQN